MGKLFRTLFRNSFELVPLLFRISSEIPFNRLKLGIMTEGGLFRFCSASVPGNRKELGGI